MAQGNGSSVQAYQQTPYAQFDVPRVAGTSSVGVGALLMRLANAADSIPMWSYFPAARDAALRAFWKTENILAGAVYSMVARGKALQFEVNAPPRAKKYAQSVLAECQHGRGLPALLERSLIDYFTQDNGVFWELIATGDPASPVGENDRLVPPYILHLDAAQCWRTFDPDYPVIYVNPITHTMHKLHRTRVIMFASMEQPDELARGIGFCAVSRVLRYVQYIRDVLVYKSEKVSGAFNRGLMLVQGATVEQLQEAVAAAQTSAAARGASVYRGVPTLARVQGDIKAEVIDLARLTDGFDTEKDLTLYVYALALAFGVDAREFWAATASGATKADASIQHMKAQGKGFADMVSTIENALRMALPDSVEVRADYTDDEADKLAAEIKAQRASLITTLHGAGIITVNEARALAVAEGVLKLELLTSPTETMVEAEPVTSTDPLDAPAVEPVQAVQEKQHPHPHQQRFDPLTSDEKALDNAQRLLADAIIISNVPRDDAGMPVDTVRNRMMFTRHMTAVLRSAGTEAYLSGMYDAGVRNPVLTPEDRRRIDAWLRTQAGYVDDFVDAIFTARYALEDASRVYHAQMWANKSLYAIYIEGLERGGGAFKRYIWRLGVAEHCSTCLRLAGQVHTMREWQRSGFLPKSDVLECGGFNCQCTLVPTDLPPRGVL